jgi:hypothetical protein
MPPLPRPKTTAAPKDTSNPSTGTKKHAERPTTSLGSDAPRVRSTPGSKRLEQDIARFYMMMGTIIRPFGKWYPAIQPISDNIKVFANDAAEAWVELADKDPRVKKILESWTSASVWGNVIGVHFAIFVSSAATKQAVESEDSNLMSSLGLSQSDIDIVNKLMSDKGGPGDTIKSDRPKQEAKIPESPVEKNVDYPSKPGIVSPNDLGVTNPGSEYDIPQTGGGIK